MMRIRQAENTTADVMAIAGMTLNFLTSTPYGAIIGSVNPQTLGQIIARVIASGVILLAEVSERPEGCARFEVDRRRPLLGPRARCATCGQAATLHKSKAIGFCAVYKAVHPLSGKLYGDELAWWVEPEHRKGRAGYYILRAVIDWARHSGLSVLKMVAPAGSDVGQFYERLGFVAVETAYQLRLSA